MKTIKKFESNLLKDSKLEKMTGGAAPFVAQAYMTYVINPDFRTGGTSASNGSNYPTLSSIDN